MARIVTVDDDRDALLLLKTILVHAGHDVLPLLKADRVVEEVMKARPDLVITDILMPGITGATVYALVRKNIGPNLPIIVSSSTRLTLGKLPPDPLLAYCPKPVDPELLAATVDRLLVAAENLEYAGSLGTNINEDIDDIDVVGT